MKRNKASIYVLLIIIILLSLLATIAGCNSSKDKNTIHFIMKSSYTTFWKTAMLGANIAASEYNLNVVFSSPTDESDYELQNKLIKDAVDGDAAAICIAAIDYNNNAEAVKYAVDKGVEVVMFDSYVQSDQKLVEIGTNNYEAGQKAGEALLSQTGEIEVALVNFYSESGNAMDRENGFRNAVKGHDRIKIVASVKSPEQWKGISDLTTEIITNSPTLDAIVTFNEITTVGVGDAIKKTNKKDEIFTIGFDNNVITIGDLENGYLDTLIVQNASAMGYLAVQNAFLLVNNKKIPSKVVDTKTVVATRENMFDKEMQNILFPILI